LEAGLTLNVVAVRQAVLSILYDVPLLADAVNVEDCPLQIVVGLAASDRLVGNAVTVAVAAAEVADTQFTPLEGAVAYTVTDLAPVVAPLTVNVPLPVPLAVPVVPPQV
jgi:hypothetical protein